MQNTIFDLITKNVPGWTNVTSPDDIVFNRLSGLSNACYKVSTKDGISADPPVLLFRKFEQELTDRRIEQAIFQTKSDDGTGPKLFFTDGTYRIEGFFHGRPISIWEMRNASIFLNYAEMICDYNFSPIA